MSTLNIERLFDNLVIVITAETDIQKMKDKIEIAIADACHSAKEKVKDSEPKESTLNGTLLEDENVILLRGLIDDWCIKICGNNDYALEKSKRMFEAALSEFCKNEKPLFPPDRIQKHS